MTLVKRNREFFPKTLTSFWDVGDFFEPDVFTNMWDFSVKSPSVNIVDNEKEYTIEVAAPGLEKKDFKIELDNHTLTIRSEKEEEKNEKKKDYKRKEFSYFSFTRSFQLPEDAKVDKIDAKYEGGILKLQIPKREGVTARPKKEIEIS